MPLSSLCVGCVQCWLTKRVGMGSDVFVFACGVCFSYPVNPCACLCSVGEFGLHIPDVSVRFRAADSPRKRMLLTVFFKH